MISALERGGGGPDLGRSEYGSFLALVGLFQGGM